MAAILYQTVLTEHSIEGKALVRISFVRDGGSPFLEMVYSEGYYEKDLEDNYVLNAIGEPTWVSKGSSWSKVVPFADEKIQALAAKYGLDILGMDEKIVSLTNEYMESLICAD